MTNSWRLLTTLTALTAAASGGAFLTYSTLTTTALKNLPNREGMAAMQQINLAAPRSPLFMALVFGPALLSAVVGIRALVHLRDRGSLLIVAGAAVYIVGVVLMTAGYHVPRNDALATKGAAYADDGWQAWLRAWVLGNHIRTLAGLAAGTLILVGGLAGSSATGRTQAGTADVGAGLSTDQGIQRSRMVLSDPTSSGLVR